MTEFHDGIYSEARRTYTPSGRSFHIPEPVNEYSRPSFVIIVLAVVLAAVSLVGVWL